MSRAEAGRAVIDFARTLARARAGMNIAAHPDSVYSCMDDLLDREGLLWVPPAIPDYRSDFAAEYAGWDRATTAQRCFNNACTLAMFNPDRLRYCEGYAVNETSMIPVHHAWCVDEHDVVVDPTWSGRFPLGRAAWFGVEVPLRVIHDVGRPGVLDGMHDHVEIFTRPWPETLLHYSHG